MHRKDEMHMIYIKVNEDGMLHTFDSTVSDGVKYETVKFDFPESWEGYTKTAVFSNEKNMLSVILNGGGDLCTGVNECYIPHEVIKYPELTVSVFGVSGNSRVTTAAAVIRVIQSGYGEGEEPKAPTPSEYEQLLNLANKTKEIADSVRLDADIGAFNGKDGYTPVLGVDYVTIDQNTEFIFEGGDARQAIPTDIVVDSELSKTSTNAIENKAVATRLEEITEAIEQAKANVLLSVYPIGAIYISVTGLSPETLFGGTWERITDKFLLAAGSSYLSGTTGGEAKHTLTVNEMPTHNHSFGAGVNETEQGTASDVFMYQGWQSSYSPAYVTSVGGGQSHNNMPPYLAVYVWKRTA